MEKSSTDSSGGLILIAPALKLLLSSAPLSMYEVPASLAPPEVGAMSSPGLTEGAIKGEDVKNVTVDQRCVLDGLGIHLVREIGGRCLHQRNFGGHFHELRGFGQFQLAVNGNGLAASRTIPETLTPPKLAALISMVYVPGGTRPKR